MKPQLKSQSEVVAPSVIPIIAGAERLSERRNEIWHLTAKRAYDLFEGRGQQVGYDVEDWLRAEGEFRSAIPVEIQDSEKHLTAYAEMPGFRADQIEVNMAPLCLVINCKTERAADQRIDGSGEWPTNEVSREFDLPARVDPSNATATFEGGILRITMPKDGV